MNYPYFDAHCDTAFEWWRRTEHPESDRFHVSLRRAEAFPAYAQFFAFCTVWNEDLPAEEQYRRAFAYFSAERRRLRHRMILCGNAEQVRGAWKNGKIAAVPALEGAEAIGCDVGRLDEAAQSGIRLITLTWNHENALGGSNLTGGGLTGQGRDFVRRCQKLGIIVDVSHASDAVFFDVCEIAEKPIVASHSDCRALCDHPRNLTDDQIRCIAQLGGFVGLNLYPPFLSDSGEADLLTVFRHYEHFCQLGAEKNVGIGADWDGVESLPAGISAMDDLPHLAETFAQFGVSDGALSGLFSENLLHTWENVGAPAASPEA